MSFTHTEIQTGTGGNDAGKVVQHIKKRRKERKKERKKENRTLESFELEGTLKGHLV